MTITTEISKLQENLANAYSTIEEKGATLPSAQNFDNLATTISSIPSATSYTAGTGIDITNDVISVTSDISTGATLGATAVQPADLASVATSGSYNDLLNKPDLNGKADIDLSNITSAGKNIANWSTNVTNCITEIPQDIKLELNNGTLTLKAGSKVYMPNGAGVFDVVTVASDIKYTYTYAPPSDSSIMLFINQSGTEFVYSRTENTCFSGETQPSGSFRNWYNTTENKMYSIGNNATVDGSGFSFPIAIITQGSDGVTKSIDQVLNGFGYIGSTVFALPGVKGLIPNGRNVDRSLKNIEFVNNSVRTYTSTNSFDNCPVIFGYDRLYALSNFKVEDTSSRIPTSGQWFSYYSPKDNRIYQSDNGGDWFTAPGYIIGNETISSGRVTSFTPKTTFHAVDYNDVVLKQDLATIPHIVETYVNGTSWYRVYSDGWCEQGGKTAVRSGDGYLDVTFLKAFSNTNYNVQQSLTGYNGNAQESLSIVNLTTTGCRLYMWTNRASFWMACGYIS